MSEEHEKEGGGIKINTLPKARPQWGKNLVPHYIGIFKSVKDIDGWVAYMQEEMLKELKGHGLDTKEAREILDGQVSSLKDSLTTHEYFGVVVATDSEGENPRVYISDIHYNNKGVGHGETREFVPEKDSTGSAILNCKMNLRLQLAHMRGNEEERKKNKEVIMLTETEGEYANLTGEAREAFNALYPQETGAIDGLGLIPSMKVRGNPRGGDLKAEIEQIKKKHGKKAAADMIRRLLS